MWLLQSKHALRDRGQRAKPAGPIISESAKLPSPSTEQVRSSNLRIKKQFTDLDKDKFRHEGFEFPDVEELVRQYPAAERRIRDLAPRPEGVAMSRERSHRESLPASRQ